MSECCLKNHCSSLDKAWVSQHTSEHRLLTAQQQNAEPQAEMSSFSNEAAVRNRDCSPRAVNSGHWQQGTPQHSFHHHLTPAGIKLKSKVLNCTPKYLTETQLTYLKYYFGEKVLQVSPEVQSKKQVLSFFFFFLVTVFNMYQLHHEKIKALSFLKTSRTLNGSFKIRILFYTSNPGTEHRLQVFLYFLQVFVVLWLSSLIWLDCIFPELFQSLSKFLITNTKQCVFSSYPPLKIQISTQIYIYRSRSLSRTSENNFRGLFLSKLHYTCGHLALVLVSVIKPRKILNGFSNISVPNITQYHHHQSNYKIPRSLKEKKSIQL